MPQYKKMGPTNQRPAAKPNQAQKQQIHDSMKRIKEIQQKQKTNPSPNAKGCNCLK